MIVSLSSAAYSNQRPLNRIIPSFLSNSDFAAVPPTRTSTNGFTSWMWRLINGKHKSISFGVGCRFPGGRHGIMLEIYTDDRSSPIDDNILSNNCPLTPTKGLPCRSSSAPGASPTNITLAFSFPSEKTRLVAVFFNEQPSYSDTANRSSSKLVILLTKFIELSDKLIFGDTTSLFL